MEDNSHCCTSGNSEPMSCSSASSGGHDRVEEELSTSLSGQLKINDVRRAPIERDYIVEDEEDEDEDGDYFSEEALLAQMGYAKPDQGIDYEEEVEDSILAQMGYLKNEPPKHEPSSTPIAELNLVSALKGSREKEGRAGEKCRVSWAPDVYDPPCTSDDHFSERHKSEQHKVKGASGKNRQKTGGKGAGVTEGRVGTGKGSRGGGSKGSEGGAKAAGGSKDKKKAEKKHKKHGGHGPPAANYSNSADC